MHNGYKFARSGCLTLCFYVTTVGFTQPAFLCDCMTAVDFTNPALAALLAAAAAAIFK